MLRIIKTGKTWAVIVDYYTRTVQLAQFSTRDDAENAMKLLQNYRR